MPKLTPTPFFLALAFAGLAYADVAVPPVARVTDLSGTLDAAQKGALEQKLAAFEQQKGSQISVLIVPTTAPETIEQYSLRVAEAWKLGRKGVDDGILLLVAKSEHALRIEVGYGLEGVVPDAIAKRVVAETITPKFREGDFYGGIDAGVTQLIGVVNGEALPPPKPASGNTPAPDSLNNLFTIGFFVLFFSRLLGRGIGELPSALVAGGVLGAIAWFFFQLAVGAAAVGAVMFVISLVFQLGKGGGGGFATGGRGFGGGSFGGGGGFSGGGGGFGGGGASGRW